MIHDHAVVHIDAGSVGDQIVMAGSILHTAQRDVAPEPDMEGAIGGFVLDVAVACTAGVGVEPMPNSAATTMFSGSWKRARNCLSRLPLALSSISTMRPPRSSTRTGLSTMPI